MNSQKDGLLKVFDKFCQNVFEANLAMLEDIDYFPIAYNKKPPMLVSLMLCIR